MPKPPKEEFDAKEAQARFEAALRGARVAGHKSMTDLPKKRAAKTKPKKEPREKP